MLYYDKGCHVLSDNIIEYLHKWHQLMLKWIENNKLGIRKLLLMDEYNWKTYGSMNQVFWEGCKKTTLEDALKEFSDSHENIIFIIESMSDQELFEKNMYDWVGTSTIGSYFVSVTSSHYEWAMKKIKDHKKRLKSL